MTDFQKLLGLQQQGLYTHDKYIMIPHVQNIAFIECTKLWKKEKHIHYLWKLVLFSCFEETFDTEVVVCLNYLTLGMFWDVECQAGCF